MTLFQIKDAIKWKRKPKNAQIVLRINFSIGN